jgi:hypothetical protein
MTGPDNQWTGKYVLIVCLLCLVLGFVIAVDIWAPR